MRIAYLTDVEGQWAKLESFATRNPLVTLDGAGRLQVAPGARFVFGGDAVDRGSAARRIVAALLDVKRRQPDQVVLLAGNRDINKMRLVTELAGAPPERTPVDVRRGPPATLLRWIFDNTMGARQAFRHRAEELASVGDAADDEAVVTSYLADLRPTGELTEYLCACQLGYREGDTLFVHGGVTRESLGHVPNAASHFDDVDAWVAGLNQFYAEQCAAFRAGEPSGYAALVAYQAPIPGTKLNQASVVYGRPTDELGNPTLPAPEVIARLGGGGVKRVVLGHTPSGECPAVLRDRAGFELVLADNSHGRVELGSQLLLDDEPRIIGVSVLDNGDTVDVSTRLAVDDVDSPLGLRDAAGRLVKARLASGDYLVFRGFTGYGVEQSAVSAGALPRPLTPPR
jgi:hypothetical protein